MSESKLQPLNIPGIENGYRVDDVIWRGAQPSDLAWPLLRQAGCRAVLDLNSGPITASRQASLANASNMWYLSADWNGILPPSPVQVKGALAALDQLVLEKSTPIFIHCQYGSDRTGTLCAIWRMHHDGWTFSDAMEEAFFGLKLQGEHEFWMAAAVAQYAASIGRTA